MRVLIPGYYAAWEVFTAYGKEGYLHRHAFLLISLRRGSRRTTEWLSFQSFSCACSSSAVNILFAWWYAGRSRRFVQSLSPALSATGSAGCRSWSRVSHPRQPLLGVIIIPFIHQVTGTCKAVCSSLPFLVLQQSRFPFLSSGGSPYPACPAKCCSELPVCFKVQFL